MRGANRGILLLVVGVGLAACSSGPPPQGTVTGGIRLEAGTVSLHELKSYRFEHQAGTVLISRSGRQIKSMQVADGHDFRTSLSPGSYSVTAKVSGFGCDPIPASISSNRTIEVEVVCGSSIPIG